MKRSALTLGIADPVMRVLVWLLACAVVSLVGAALGYLPMAILIVVLLILVTRDRPDDR